MINFYYRIGEIILEIKIKYFTDVQPIEKIEKGDFIKQ